jgi:hypothetical protein
MGAAIQQWLQLPKTSDQRNLKNKILRAKGALAGIIVVAALLILLVFRFYTTSIIESKACLNREYLSLIIIVIAALEAHFAVARDKN